MNIRLHTFKPRSVRVLLCIAAYLPMMFGGAGAFVLCFGDGGHLAIEFAHEGGHDNTSSHMDESEPEHHGSISDAGCNTCFDVPLTVDNAEPHMVKGSDTRTLILLDQESAQSAPGTVAPVNEDIFVLQNRPPPPRLSLEGLSTTVLRT